MYVLKMNSDTDKSLVTTIHSTIYQGERNADTIKFLIPMFYEDKNIADCTMLLRYILPDGEGKSEEIEMDAEPYKNYYCYRLKTGTNFTETAGKIELWLSAIDMYDNYILKSGKAYIEILPAKNIADYFPPEDLDQLDALSAKVADLEQTKADNIVYDKSNNQLQLSSNGILIGDSVNISSDTSDDVIEFDNIDNKNSIVSDNKQSLVGDDIIEF